MTKRKREISKESKNRTGQGQDMDEATVTEQLRTIYAIVVQSASKEEDSMFKINLAKWVELKQV